MIPGITQASYLLDLEAIKRLRERNVNFVGAANFYKSFSDEINNFCTHLDSLLRDNVVDLTSNQINDFIPTLNLGIRESNFSANIFRALEKISLDLSTQEIELIQTSLPIVNSFMQEGALRWKPEHQIPNFSSGDMNANSIEKMRQQFNAESSAEIHPANNFIPNSHIEFKDRGKTRYLELANVGSIGVIFRIYNADKYPVKAVRLISGLNDAKAAQIKGYFDDYRAASEQVCDNSLVPVGEAIVTNNTIMEPMKALQDSSPTMEQRLLEILPIKDDNQALDSETLQEVLKIFLKLANCIKSSHDAGFAHVNAKLDSYRVNPDKSISKVNQSLFTKSNIELSETPFFGSYALRDFSHDALSESPKPDAVKWSDINSLGIYLAQALLGKEDGRLSLLYRGAKNPDAPPDTNWLEAIMYGKVGQGCAHSQGSIQYDHMKTKYCWEGAYNDGSTLQAKLKTKLGIENDEDPKMKLVQLIEDMCIYKDDGNGFRNLRFRNDDGTTTEPNIDRVIEVLHAL